MRLARWLVCLVLGFVGCSSDAVDPITTAPPTASTSTTAADTTTSHSPTTTVADTTTTSTEALTGAVIVIDPGHNGMNWAHPDEIGELVHIGNGTKPCNTTGTSTADGYTEAEFNWEVAMVVQPLLESAGASVILTRPDNDGWGPCINERAAVGNSSEADATISIHADGGPDGGRGFHVIYPASVSGLTDDIADESRRLAVEMVSAYLTTGMPIADYIGEGGFSERDDLGGLNLSDVPAVFLETGNMRNDADAALLEDPTFQMAIARAIAEAVTGFLAG